MERNRVHIAHGLCKSMKAPIPYLKIRRRDSNCSLQFVVGLWIPGWKFLGSSKDRSGAGLETSTVNNETTGYGPASLAGLLLGSAMVARGEIGLLIIEVGYNETSYVSQDGFITAVWAILLNTIIGPVIVGNLVKYWGKRIGEGEWGLQTEEQPLIPNPSRPQA